MSWGTKLCHEEDSNPQRWKTCWLHAECLTASTTGRDLLITRGMPYRFDHRERPADYTRNALPLRPPGETCWLHAECLTASQCDYVMRDEALPPGGPADYTRNALPLRPPGETCWLHAECLTASTTGRDLLITRGMPYRFDHRERPADYKRNALPLRPPGETCWLHAECLTASTTGRDLLITSGMPYRFDHRERPADYKRNALPLRPPGVLHKTCKLMGLDLSPDCFVLFSLCLIFILFFQMSNCQIWSRDVTPRLKYEESKGHLRSPCTPNMEQFWPVFTELRHFEAPSKERPTYEFRSDSGIFFIELSC